METPPVRILQRPCQVAVKNPSESLKPPTTVKTLEQREADYAAARRRIMGSDGTEQDECDATLTTSAKSTTAMETPVGYSAPRLGPGVGNSNVTTTATPLMSIQALPTGVGFTPDFRLAAGTTSCFSTSSVGPPRNAAYTTRQGSAINCVPKPQQQLPSVLSGSRSTPQQRILAASNSSPALFMPSRPTQHMPVYPTQPNNAPNVGLLPSPQGFNFPSNSTMPDGVGMHHSHSTAASLMHHFGLLQQQYQPPVNSSFQPLISPYSQTNNSINPLNYGMAPLFGANHNVEFGIDNAACTPANFQLTRFPPSTMDSLLLP